MSSSKDQGPDGSSSTAKLVNSQSSTSIIEAKPRKPWTVLRVLNRIWKVIKYIYSCALLGLTLGICFYVIGIGQSSFFDTVPIWLDYILFVIFIFFLATLEGTMISLSQLRRVSPASYAKTHPATLRNAQLAFQPDYLEKFLMGRQANVIVLVFMLSRLLSTPSSEVHVGTLADWITSGFMQTGLFGAFIVLIIGNLVPQVTAAKFPVQFINTIYINIVIRWCLFVRWIGLPHACWLCAKSIAFILGLKWNAPPLGSEPAAEKKPATESNGDGSPTEETAGLKTTGDDKVYATDYDGFAAKYNLSTSVRTLHASIPASVRKVIVAKDESQGESESLHWASRERVAEIYTKNSLTTPDFLVPSTSASYVPAHIVAFQLVVENQRLLRELEAANVDFNNDEVKAVSTPLYTSLKSVVDAAALDRLHVVAV